MRLGRVIGKVWATAKDKRLQGVKLMIMEVIDENQQPIGRTFVAADTIGSRYGDVVFWVSGAEATRPFKDRNIPSDVTIVGLVDSLDM